MVNIGGYAALSKLMVIGVSILVLIVVISYFVHHYLSKRVSGDTGRPATGEISSRKVALRKILFHPDVSFGQVTESKTNLFRPFLLITISGLIFYTGFWSLVLFLSRKTGLLLALFWGIGSYPFTVIFIYLGWCILSALFFTLSTLFKGTGLFKTTLQNTGYGMAFVLLFSGVLVVVSTGINSSLLGDPNFDEFQRAVAATGIPYESPDQIPTEIIYILSLIPFIGGVILWSYGLKHSRTIPFSRATILVSVVIAVIVGICGICGWYLLTRYGQAF
jgi:hypothetical protein